MKETLTSDDMNQGRTNSNKRVEEQLIEELPVNIRMAFERTRCSYERTMMAWVRTGNSLIAFGFTFYYFFQLEI